MNQHLIQKAWIKYFSQKGKTLKVNKLDLSKVLVRPKDVACLEDFQSPANESADQKVEVEVIRELHGVRKGTTKKLEDSRGLDLWVATHLSRNPRDIEGLKEQGMTYDKARLALIDDSMRMIRGMVGDAGRWIVLATEYDEPLILSDHPIVNFDGVGLLVPLSDKILMVYSKHAPNTWNFHGRTLFEGINEMTFGFARSYVLCHPERFPNLEELRVRTRLRTQMGGDDRPVKVPAD